MNPNRRPSVRSLLKSAQRPHLMVGRGGNVTIALSPRLALLLSR